MFRVRALVCSMLLTGCTAGEPEWPAWAANKLTLQLPADTKLAAGEPLRVLVVSSAPLGSVAALQAHGVPAGATFGDRGDGTAFFFWTPTTAQTGAYDITVSAVAGKNRVRKTWSLTVVAAKTGNDSDTIMSNSGDPGDSGDPVNPPAGNVAPSLQGAHLASPSYTRLHALEAVAEGWADPEGAPQAFITLWFVAGRRVTAETDAILTPEHFAHGDTVSAVLYPLDGELIGEPVTAPAITVDDAAPEISLATLSSGPYMAGKALQAYAWGWFDIDGDAPRYAVRWFVDGALTGVTAATLEPMWFTRGATVTAEITPVSGARYGAGIFTSTVVIGNAPPVPPRVRIHRQGVKWDSSTLALDLVAPASDPDGDAVTLHYAWYVNGALFATGVSQAAVQYNLRQGDLWSVRVTAFDGEAESPETEAVMQADLRRVKQVALGLSHTCAVLNEGLVQCWGANAKGQLGNNTGTISYSSPMPINNQTGNTMQVSTRADHTCALEVGGTVRCWGENANAQLGIGLKGGTYNTPQNVSGLHVGVSMVAAGNTHTCALGYDARVYCWGDNSAGQVGAGAASETTVPTLVPGLPQPVSAVTAGGSHSCALTIAGVVWCWGSNGTGQLGAGLAAVQSALPVSVAAFTAAQVVAGDSHTCARSAGGVLKCWGSNTFGQLGNGDAGVVSSNVPLAVVGGDTYADVAAGNQLTCGVLAGGSAKCWGKDDMKQLGNGTLSAGATPTPQLVTGMAGTSGLGAGGAHACALTRGGGVKCWGSRWDGQVGDANVTTVAMGTPAAVVGLSKVGVAAVAAGGEFTCALSMANGVKCWGKGTAKQLGNGAALNSTYPVDVVGLQSGVVQLEAGDEFACARLSNGTGKCWGIGQYGSLGNGTFVSSATPVVLTGSSIAKISLGSTHGCLVESGGNSRCWGNSPDGWVSFGPSPQLLPPGYYDVSAGGSHTCVLRTAASGGGVFCRGRNDFGQLGDGTQTSTFSWVSAISSGPFGDLALGFEHSCVRTGTNSYCWGNGWSGETGQNVFAVQLVPNAIKASSSTALFGITQLVAGFDRTCATTAASFFCFGAAYLGDGSTLNQSLPVSLPIDVASISVSKGSFGGGPRGHICAIDQRQALFCWGQNDNGQLGRSDTGIAVPGEAYLSSYWW